MMETLKCSISVIKLADGTILEPYPGMKHLWRDSKDRTFVIKGRMAIRC